MDVRNKRVVVSGKIPGMSRAEVKAALEAMGATVLSSVSSKTDLVIAPESKKPSTKVLEARYHGVPVVLPEQVGLPGAPASTPPKQKVQPRGKTRRTSRKKVFPPADPGSVEQVAERVLQYAANGVRMDWHETMPALATRVDDPARFVGFMDDVEPRRRDEAFGASALIYLLRDLPGAADALIEAAGDPAGVEAPGALGAAVYLRGDHEAGKALLRRAMGEATEHRQMQRVLYASVVAGDEELARDALSRCAELCDYDPPGHVTDALVDAGPEACALACRLYAARGLSLRHDLEDEALDAGWRSDDHWTLKACEVRVAEGRADEVRDRLEGWYRSGGRFGFDAVRFALRLFPRDPVWVDRLRELKVGYPEERAEVVALMWDNGLDDEARQYPIFSGVEAAALVRRLPDAEVEAVVRGLLSSGDISRWNPADAVLAAVLRDRGAEQLAVEVVERIIADGKRHGRGDLVGDLAQAGLFADAYALAMKTRGGARDGNMSRLAHFLGAAEHWSGVDACLDRISSPWLALSALRGALWTGRFSHGLQFI